MRHSASTSLAAGSEPGRLEIGTLLAFGLQCEKGVWLMLQLYGACVLPAGSFGCELWGVWLLRGQFRKTRDHLSTLYHGHLSNLSGVRRTVPTPILLEELGSSHWQTCG